MVSYYFISVEPYCRLFTVLSIWCKVIFFICPVTSWGRPCCFNFFSMWAKWGSELWRSCPAHTVGKLYSWNRVPVLCSELGHFPPWRPGEVFRKGGRNNVSGSLIQVINHQTSYKSLKIFRPQTSRKQTCVKTPPGDCVARLYLGIFG